MDPKYYGLVEVVFTAAIVFGLGFWQLWSLRAARGSDKRSGGGDDPQPPT